LWKASESKPDRASEKILEKNFKNYLEMKISYEMLRTTKNFVYEQALVFLIWDSFPSWEKFPEREWQKLTQF